MTRHTYEIRVIGTLSPAACEAFAGMQVEVGPTVTILSGEFDQRDLHAVLNRLRTFDLELVGVRQAPRT